MNNSTEFDIIATIALVYFGVLLFVWFIKDFTEFKNKKKK